VAIFLSTDDVMSRYRLRDKRTARSIMDAAGAMKVAGRLLVSEVDLEAWEARQKQRRAEQASPPETTLETTARRPRARPRDRQANDPLPPGWWRESA
jgi:hypothetical protein